MGIEIPVEINPLNRKTFGRILRGGVTGENWRGKDRDIKKKKKKSLRSYYERETGGGDDYGAQVASAEEVYLRLGFYDSFSTHKN